MARDNWEVEQHPFEPLMNDNTTILVIGTFPTYRDNYTDTFSYYYGGKSNRFWPIIKKVFGVKFQYGAGKMAVEERKNFLDERRIGVTDMIRKCYRRNNSSDDRDIYPILLLDVFDVLKKYQNIRRLVLTSRTPVFGALGLFKTYFLQKGLQLNDEWEGKDRIVRAWFEINDRRIEVLVPHSTSMKNDNVTVEELEDMYSISLK